MKKTTDTKFRRYLDERGISAYQLAKATGIDYLKLTRYVTGHVAHPRADLLARVTGALQCKLEDIY